ncbi:MAG TPA: PKD domain-containing protein, partial [Thermoanaerobaculia bacterium]|nr:PKD domain-containing protein [Thermoanaerobaculia bacterium]
MMQRRLSRPHLASSWLLLPALLAAQLVAPPLVAQQTCGNTCSSHCGYLPCGTPAMPPPQSYWGELQPADPPCVGLPSTRDDTGFNVSVDNLANFNFWMDVDIQNGFIFAAMAYGLQIWDTSADAANPTLAGSIGPAAFPFLPTNSDGAFTPVSMISAPPGVDTMVGLGASNGGVGAVVINTSSKTQPKVAYQALANTVGGIYATTLSGTHYLFVASQGPAGVYLLNMDRASQLASCDEPIQTPGRCSGANLGAILPTYGYGIAGVDHFIAVSGSDGLKIYDVTNPMSPQLKASGLSSAGQLIGAAMWKGPDAHYYAATRQENAGQASDTLYIYDVSCAASSTCTGLGTLMSQTVYQESAAQQMYLTYSNSNGTPFLYLGRDSTCGVSQQEEWLLDVANPSVPRDISPQTGYWSFYYSGNATGTGFNNFEPRTGKFNGSYFYRAGYTVLDVHKWVSVTAPTAAFTWSPAPPAPIYPGTPVTFTSLSTGGQLSCSWTFQDGSPATSSTCNPTVTFPTHATYPTNEAVSLKVTNTAGTNTLIQTVPVANPAAQVASISVSPANPLQCQTVTLTANATGEAPLAYSWNIVNGSNQAAMGGTSTANPFAWSTTMSAAGPYTAGVTVTAGAGGPFTLQQGFTLGALPTLAASGSFSPIPTNATNTPPTPPYTFASGTVDFNVVAAGATAWNWNFGDNPGGGPNHDGYVGWSTDPLAGPSPSHTYTAVGPYTVTVQVQNCVNLGPSVSTPLTVDITQVTPLLASFAPACPYAPCTGAVNTPVSFIDSSTGMPTTWDYDWNGTGTFSDTGHTAPVTQHTYSTVGFYKPALRVNRGGESNTYAFSQGISIVSASPPTISVGGPSQGAIGTAYTFTAFASNCTPAGSGWSWSTGGGTGSSTSSSINVTWANAGSYLVSASNSACSGASGSAGVTITGSNGGGTLQAAFSFSPTSPFAGGTVAFDGSASTGATAYTWFFGDPNDPTGSSSVQATHVYSQMGTYTVKLDVSAPGNCPQNVCINETAQAITVAGTSPQPL